MAVDDREILARVPRGGGLALDLGGTLGARRSAIERRGYEYINLDLKPDGPKKVQGDAHRMPFADEVFSLVVCAEAFESLTDLKLALSEIRRVLEPNGVFLVWAPLMSQFGGDDLYRFTALGLRYLLETAGFKIDSLEGPEGVFIIFSELPVAGLRRHGVTRFESAFERIGRRLDRIFHRKRSLATARAFVLAARLADPSSVGRHAEELPGRTSAAPSRTAPTLTDRLTLDLIPNGTGPAVFIEGKGSLGREVERRGYALAAPSVEREQRDDRLPYATGSVSLVITTNGLGRFADPFLGIQEIRRVLSDDGLFVAWSPYLWPARSGEHMRFTPLGFAVILRWAGFQVRSFDAPLRLFSVLGRLTTHSLHLNECGTVASSLDRLAYRLDRRGRRLWGLGYSFAGGFTFGATPTEPRADDLLGARKIPVADLWRELGDMRAAELYEGTAPPAQRGT